jgi:hypothetical protein
LFRVLGYGAGFALLAVAGCGQGGQNGDQNEAGGRLPASLGPDELVLRVEYTGGFTRPVELATRLPIISVYGDGRVITSAPVPAIYPGPSLPALQVHQATPAEVTRILTEAIAGGAADGGEFGEPPIADAANTRFTVLTADGLASTEVYALSEAGDTGMDGLTSAQRQARQRLSALFDKLTAFPDSLGESKAYQATEMLAVASLWADPGQTDMMLPVPPEVAWPGPELPGLPLPDLGCVAATGDQLAKINEAAARATAATPWTSGAKRWTITFRPLLPEENGCATVLPDAGPTPT